MSNEFDVEKAVSNCQFCKMIAPAKPAPTRLAGATQLLSLHHQLAAEGGVAIADAEVIHPFGMSGEVHCLGPLSSRLQGSGGEDLLAEAVEYLHPQGPSFEQDCFYNEPTGSRVGIDVERAEAWQFDGSQRGYIGGREF